MTPKDSRTPDYQAGWSEGYRHGLNEGLLRAFPQGYDIGTPDNPVQQFTNVIVQADGVIVDESSSPPPYRRHSPTSARAHAAALWAAANAAEANHV